MGYFTSADGQDRDYFVIRRVRFVIRNSRLYGPRSFVSTRTVRFRVR